MRINIASIVKMPGSRMDIEKSIDPSEFGDRAEGIEFIGNIQLCGQAKNISEGIIEVTGKLDAKINCQCARCLRDVEFPIDVDFDEKFSRSSQEDDVYRFSEDTLDIDDMVIDNLLLEAPMRVLCSPDCRGLCPQCGADLNNSQCSCREEAVLDENNPLLALKARLCDDEEV